ncbi:MAG TPA: glycosyltransferase family 2 protein [bacterium]|nr:glycosyltransferase family 2 protein [bacterium]
MKIAVIIPAYNEEDVIGKVIAEVPRNIPDIGPVRIYVVDDGSVDKTGNIAHAKGAHVVKHAVNLGVGAATVTGIQAALHDGADILVTLDGDGQHDPKEIKTLITPIVQNKIDFVIGSRFIKKASKRTPKIRIAGNRIMNIITFIFYRVWLSDTQSGYKAFPARVAEQMHLSFFGYEICSEMIGEIRRLRLKYTEVPVKVIYSQYSIKKGQSIFNGVNILLKMIVRFILGR